MRPESRGTARALRLPVPCALLVPTLLLAAPLAGLGAQAGPTIGLAGPSGQGLRVELARHRGYGAVPVSSLVAVGWSVTSGGSGARLTLEGRAGVELTAGTPYFRWDGELLQLAEAPYFFGERLYAPLQLVSGFLPRRLPDIYDFEPGSRILTVRQEGLWRPDAPRRSTAAREGRPSGSGKGAPEAGLADRRRVVIIDAGHGGKDIGARGPGGVVEKEITLAVARALARELADDPDLEVHLTRDDDTFVPVWERGERATGWKEDRPGVFVSLHANAAGRSSSVRGLETYFLSEARTEHERRVAALENASMELETAEERPPGRGSDLSFIRQDLLNRDTQHWSSILAEHVQEELAPVHPGPDRGVKQAPLAVITNALMPGVLVELGFITNPSEARLLARNSFQDAAARALADALREFFQRYPPGDGTTVGSQR